MALRVLLLFALALFASTAMADQASPWGGHAAAGKARAAVCGACHGSDGNPDSSAYPTLAGQHESYIFGELRDYKSGQRANPIMTAMSAALSEQDMHDIGAYFASQSPRPTRSGASAEQIAAGARLYQAGAAERQIPACAACHGRTGAGNPGSIYPQLRDQSAVYIAARLTHWQQVPISTQNPRDAIMPTIAHQLNDDDIKAVAAYLQQLDGPSTQ